MQCQRLQTLVQLQSGEPSALVLPRVDFEGAGTAGPVPSFHHGGQPRPVAPDPGPLSQRLLRHFLPAIRAGGVDSRPGAGVRLLRPGPGQRACAGGRFSGVADFCGLRHRQPGLLRPVGPAGRDLVPGGGVLLRLPPGGTAEDRRRVCPGPAGAGGGQGDHKGDRGPVGGKLHRGAAAGGIPMWPTASG